MSTSEQHTQKQSKIRYTEYYGLQNLYDTLYRDSGGNKVFSNLMELITSKENIKLAYRNIKGNKGSHTAGVDGRNIKHLSKLNEEQYISLIEKQFHWYKPRPVKRGKYQNQTVRPDLLEYQPLLTALYSNVFCKS